MDEKSNYTAPVSTRTTEETREKLEKLASDDSRPLAQYVRLVLERHVEEAAKNGAKQKAA